MSEQFAHYAEVQNEPTYRTELDFDGLYSIAEKDFSAERFLEKSLSKKISVLKEQIESCEKELSEREKIHEVQIKELNDKKEEFRSALTNQMKMRKIASGETLQEQKAEVSEKIDDTEDKIREEERENWRDKQKLKDKIRDLRKEVQELKKRKNLMKVYAGIL